MALEYDAKPGDIYVTPDGEVWRVLGYQANPTVLLERLVGINDSVNGHPQETHAVGCLNAEKFKRLKPTD